MGLFLGFLNKLNNNWELFLKQPMVFLMCIALGIAIVTSTTRRLYKKRVNSDLIYERNLLESELNREKEKSSNLGVKNEKLIIENRE